MQHAQSSEGMSLSYYGGVLRRRWRAILVAGFLGLWAAIALLWAVPQQATATAIVSVNIITNDPFNLSRSASGLLDLESETQIASSAAVADRAASLLGDGVTASEVRSSVDAVGVNDTSIIRVSATANTAAEARAMADAVASEYLTYRSSQAQARIDRTLENSRARLESLRADLADANEREKAASAAEDVDSLTQAETDRSLITLEITSLLSQLATTEAIDTTAGSVLTPAERSEVSMSPPAALVLATGLLAGLGLGVLAAFLLQARGGRVHSGWDVVNSGGHSLLGELTSREGHVPAQGHDVEQHRAIREALLAEPAFDGQHGVCVIIDESKAGTASEVPLNLALSIAEVGLAVEFIGLGMSQDMLEGVVDPLGLRSDGHMGSATIYASQIFPTFRLLDVRTTERRKSPDPVSPVIRDEIRARKSDSLVVLAVPPGAAEATRLAALRVSDVVVLIVGKRVTSMSALKRTARDAERMDAQVVGSILVGQRRSLVLPKASVTPDQDPVPHPAHSRS